MELADPMELAHEAYLNPTVLPQLFSNEALHVAFTAFEPQLLALKSPKEANLVAKDCLPRQLPVVVSIGS